jgi:asparagine synthase (glutamine-hydrolysing)
VWTDPEAGIAISHRRLAIVDLSPAGHQPMISPCGRYVLAFNGEIYNHRELRSYLGTVQDQIWRGSSDTETLLALIALRGLALALKACVGMFALALWDRQTRTLSLARDRMGEKPLYYGWQNGSFLFASELKALLVHPNFSAQPSREAIALLLRFNYISAPYSIYEHVHKLTPGCILVVSREQRRTDEQPYWSLTTAAVAGENNPLCGSDEEIADGVEQTLMQAVNGQMLADVPLGALLSGGIDSTVVVALMQRQSSAAVKTFTIGFAERDYNEATHAAAVAEYLGTDHTELNLSPDEALSIIPDLPTTYDEPFADSSQIPTQLVMRLARSQVTVALSGDGGDELFAGYNRYRLVPTVMQSAGRLPSSVRRRISTSMLAVRAENWDRTLRPFASVLGLAQIGEKIHKLGSRLSAAGTADDLFLSLLTHWDRTNVVLGAHEPRSLLNDREAWPRLSPVSRMMALDAMTYLPDDILTKVDRAAMAVSLETRAPFLDHRVVEIAWRLPQSAKLRGSVGKWVVRKILERHVPAELFNRPKMGFGVPLDVWLRGPLRPWAEALIEPSLLRQQGYFDPAEVERAWNAQLRGASNGSRLWSILMFQAWLTSVCPGTRLRAA